MQTPVEIEFHGLAASAEAQATINRHVASVKID
jgi:hypothetical protein